LPSSIQRCGHQVKQLHHAGGINPLAAAKARPFGFVAVAQIHECDRQLIRLQFRCRKLCEGFIRGAVNDRLQRRRGFEFERGFGLGRKVHRDSDD